ncbi:MAG: transporter substrate-binding domain-containing protein [Magnetococcales bacterium]|nr:transporter substrate-binding domain-containing protein [Magnetococcales bacterium]
MALSVVLMVLTSLLPRVVAADDALLVGSEVGYPPFAIVNSNGEADGFSVDLFKAVAEVMGLPVIFRVGPWDEVRHALEKGEIDALPLVSYSTERDKLFDYTTPHTVSYAVAFVRKGGAPIRRKVDLRGRTILVMQSDATHDYLKKNQVTSKILATKTVADSLRRLASGEGDLALVPRLVALLTVHELGLTNLESSGPKIDVYGHGYRFAVREGNSHLRDQLNQGLSIIKATGRYDEIYDKWFGIVDPRGVPLQKIRRYGLMAGVGLFFLMLMGVLWTWALRRQVKLRTQELTRANQALIRSEARYADLYDFSPDMYASVDAATAIIKQCNQTVADNLGYTKEEIIGREIFELYHPDCLDKVHQVFQTFVESGEIQNAELQLKRRDGRQIDVNLNATSVKDDQGKILYSRSCWVDITHAKRMEHALRKAKEAADRANEAKSMFLSNMSHEIRTPMNSVIGMAQLLEETPLNKRQMGYVRIFKAAGEALLSIINDVLDMSKIEAGQVMLESVPFDLEPLMDTLCDILSPSAHDKGLEISWQRIGPLPSVLQGDPSRLRQILLNLMSNAVKFTHKGEVRVKVSTASMANDQVRLIFSVIDTGIGIPFEKQEVIFDPFGQADASINRSHGGTGLGLSIARRYVKMMGGDLTLESKPKQGSCFSFSIVLSQGSAQDINPFTMPDLHGKRILVVDDYDVNRIIIKEMFQETGAEIIEAADGEEGLREVERAREEGHPYHIVLLDFRMPKLNGVQVANCLDAGYAAEIPILMLTSDILRAQHQSLVAQMNIIAKPIKRGELFTRVEEALSGKKTPPSEPQQSEDLLQTPLRILLADDAKENRMLVHAFSRATAFTIDDVENGQQALDRFREQRYDLVLMDIQMPVMDGYTALQAMRSFEKEHGREPIPMIALTAYAMEEERQRSLAAGANLHLGKPIKKDQLLGAIRDACGGG